MASWLGPQRLNLVDPAIAARTGNPAARRCSAEIRWTSRLKMTTMINTTHNHSKSSNKDNGDNGNSDNEDNTENEC